MVLPLSIFALTVILVMTRPKPLNEATAASLGACLMLATGVVSLPQAVEVLTDSTNVLPNIAIFGSLSSMLWLFLLRRRGLDIHPLQYLKLGLMITPLMLIVGALSLYACGLVWG